MQEKNQINELALFAGAGGGIFGGRLCGFRTVCAVEIEPYARQILMARQDDRSFEPFPIWDDVQTFDGKPWRGVVDIVTGGFPCQDISSAGRGAGISGQRSGLWAEMARIVGEVGPRFVLVENSPLLVGRGLAMVISDLADLGYDASWGVVGACHIAAPHMRERLWLLADSDPGRCPPPDKAAQRHANRDAQPRFTSAKWYEAEPGVARVVDGLADWRKRVRAIGNGQVPGVVKLAWECLSLND